eukprot:TRINITY_DN1790_c0_g1_i1.p2 TRINITY_DN1790_c0_g1~~TRINITY_DN1790_c0_g1_i1.p2  ORF type:complete len:173 (-),score=50.41 TRINITY_DN1790_c0_g1_i1:405-923(-)
MSSLLLLSTALRVSSRAPAALAPFAALPSSWHAAGASAAHGNGSRLSFSSDTSAPAEPENAAEKPAIGRKFPYRVALEEGKRYSWCACGLTKKEPFCDGSHKHTQGIKPVRFVAERSEKRFLCGCKQSSNKPFCDLTHVSVIAKGLFGKNEHSMTDSRRAEVEASIASGAKK